MAGRMHEDTGQFMESWRTGAWHDQTRPYGLHHRNDRLRLRFRHVTTPESKCGIFRRVVGRMLQGRTVTKGRAMDGIGPMWQTSCLLPSAHAGPHTVRPISPFNQHVLQLPLGVLPGRVINLAKDKFYGLSTLGSLPGVASRRAPRTTAAK